MANNTLVNSKKINAMDRASLFGKMAENTMVVGCVESKVELAITEIPMVTDAKACGSMASAKIG